MSEQGRPKYVYAFEEGGRDQESHHGRLGRVLEAFDVAQDRGEVPARCGSGEHERNPCRPVHLANIMAALRWEGPGRNDVIP